MNKIIVVVITAISFAVLVLFFVLLLKKPTKKQSKQIKKINGKDINELTKVVKVNITRTVTQLEQMAGSAIANRLELDERVTGKTYDVDMVFEDEEGRTEEITSEERALIGNMKDLKDAFARLKDGSVTPDEVEFERRTAEQKQSELDNLTEDYEREMQASDKPTYLGQDDTAYQRSMAEFFGEGRTPEEIEAEQIEKIKQYGDKETAELGEAVAVPMDEPEYTDLSSYRESIEDESEIFEQSESLRESEQVEQEEDSDTIEQASEESNSQLAEKSSDDMQENKLAENESQEESAMAAENLKSENPDNAEAPVTRVADAKLVETNDPVQMNLFDMEAIPVKQQTGYSFDEDGNFT